VGGFDSLDFSIDLLFPFECGELSKDFFLASFMGCNPGSTLRAPVFQRNNDKTPKPMTMIFFLHSPFSDASLRIFPTTRIVRSQQSEPMGTFTKAVFYLPKVCSPKLCFSLPILTLLVSKNSKAASIHLHPQNNPCTTCSLQKIYSS
jgi:hypothetical protein